MCDKFKISVNIISIKKFESLDVETHCKIMGRGVIYSIVDVTGNKWYNLSEDKMIEHFITLDDYYKYKKRENIIDKILDDDER